MKLQALFENRLGIFLIALNRFITWLSKSPWYSPTQKQTPPTQKHDVAAHGFGSHFHNSPKVEPSGNVHWLAEGQYNDPPLPTISFCVIAIVNHSLEQQMENSREKEFCSLRLHPVWATQWKPMLFLSTHQGHASLLCPVSPCSPPCPPTVPRPSDGLWWCCGARVEGIVISLSGPNAQQWQLYLSVLILYTQGVCVGWEVYFNNCGHSLTKPNLYLKLYYKHLYIGNNTVCTGLGSIRHPRGLL